MCFGFELRTMSCEREGGSEMDLRDEVKNAGVTAVTKRTAR